MTLVKQISKKKQSYKSETIKRHLLNKDKFSLFFDKHEYQKNLDYLSENKTNKLEYQQFFKTYLFKAIYL